MGWTKRLIVLAFLAATVSGSLHKVQAATISVPADYDTITSAIEAANPGDDVVITDSATYPEILVIDKHVNIYPALGQRPTIAPILDNEEGIIINNGAQGTKIGSLSGGRLTLGDQAQNGDPLIDVNIATGTVEFENCDIFDFKQIINIDDETTTETTIVFDDVEMNSNSGPLARWYEVQIRNHVNLVFNKTVVRGGPRTAIVMDRGGEVTITATNSIFGTLENPEQGQSNRGAIWIDRNDAEVVLDFDSCVIAGGQGDEGLFSGGTGTSPYALYFDDGVVTATIARSVIESMAGNDTDDGVSNDEPGANPTGIEIRAAGENKNVTLDYCDIYTSGTAFYLAENDGSASRTITIINSNLVSLNENATSGTIDAVHDTVVMNFNNLYAPNGTLYGGDFSAGANDLNVDPQYVAPLIYNLASQNNALDGADSTGSAQIGSDQAFYAIVPVELSTFSLQ